MGRNIYNVFLPRLGWVGLGWGLGTPRLSPCFPIGCYASILVTATTTILSEQLDGQTALGVAGTIYGCVTTSWAPVGKIGKWVKTGIDLGLCALGASSAIKDENDYLNNPTAANEAKFVADDVGFVLGCGLTGIETAIEP